MLPRRCFSGLRTVTDAATLRVRSRDYIVLKIELDSAEEAAPMPKGKGWIVTLSGNRPIGDVARDLARAGFKVDRVNEQISSISGTGDSRLKSKLKGIKGVVDVTPDTPIDIGPPRSSKTW